MTVRAVLVLVALAATAVWLTGGWLAALASRERRWPLVLATINTAIFLALLLMTLHGLEPVSYTHLTLPTILRV